MKKTIEMQHSEETRKTIEAIRIKRGEVAVRHFDGLKDWEALKVSDVNAERFGNNHEYDTRLSWWGIEGGRAAVMKIVESGVWEDGVKRMAKCFDAIEVPAPMSIRRTLDRGEFGDELDIHRVYSGALDKAWSRRVRKVRAKIAQKTLFFPLLLSCQTDTEEFFWRGAAMIKLADALTAAGYSVAIVGHHGTSHGGYACYDRVVVKDHTMPLDLPALALASCFAGYSRTVGFKAVCSLPFHVSSGLGRADYTVPRDWIGPDTVQDFSRVNNKESAILFIQEKLEELTDNNREAA